MRSVPAYVQGIMMLHSKIHRKRLKYQRDWEAQGQGTPEPQPGKMMYLMYLERALQTMGKGNERLYTAFSIERKRHFPPFTESQLSEVDQLRAWFMSDEALAVYFPWYHSSLSSLHHASPSADAPPHVSRESESAMSEDESVTPDNENVRSRSDGATSENESATAEEDLANLPKEEGVFNADKDTPGGISAHSDLENNEGLTFVDDHFSPAEEKPGETSSGEEEAVESDLESEAEENKKEIPVYTVSWKKSGTGVEKTVIASDQPRKPFRFEELNGNFKERMTQFVYVLQPIAVSYLSSSLQDDRHVLGPARTLFTK